MAGRWEASQRVDSACFAVCAAQDAGSWDIVWVNHWHFCQKPLLPSSLSWCPTPPQPLPPLGLFFPWQQALVNSPERNFLVSRSNSHNILLTTLIWPLELNGIQCIYNVVQLPAISSFKMFSSAHKSTLLHIHWVITLYFPHPQPLLISKQLSRVSPVLGISYKRNMWPLVSGFFCLKRCFRGSSKW